MCGANSLADGDDKLSNGPDDFSDLEIVERLPPLPPPPGAPEQLTRMQVFHFFFSFSIVFSLVFGVSFLGVMGRPLIWRGRM